MCLGFQYVSRILNVWYEAAGSPGQHVLHARHHGVVELFHLVCLVDHFLLLLLVQEVLGVVVI